MTKQLDRGVEAGVKEDVLALVEERGYNAEEALPGLVQAIIELSFEIKDQEQAIDEVVELLTADSSVTTDEYGEVLGGEVG